MQEQSVTRNIKQMDTRTVLILHMSDWFLEKFWYIEKSFIFLYIQNTYNVSNTNTHKV